ncbi:hypothetical protein E5206_18755 [Arthrobacter sp. PAMC25564]|uniref:hypothetical protein n=1 Tax=Arthrobacter sp. PAMC25564 TaxID=2565366 RepID=UPI0010A225A3|nr:hypothetical protein [Arthrobacter sp. PAMC25564]QCB98697.1 hypothetical protein E5206_18755 [Arthrobacter sp. PAMC25564]
MIAILQWTTLAACGIVALARIPSALRGQNPSIFGIFALSTFAVLLSIEEPYMAIDAWLGSNNYTNLILRFLAYGTILMAGYRIARAFDAPKSIGAIVGPAGLGVLLMIAVATVTLFLLADTTGSVTGLTTLPNRSPRNADLIELYAAAGRLYPSYVAACILPATIHAAGKKLPMAIRVGALLLTGAFAGMVLGSFAPLIPQPLAFLKYFISYIPILFLAVGLALVWISSLVAQRKSKKKPGYTELSQTEHSQNH